MTTEITCPRCGASALNRYGRTRTGRERFICLVCNRQFSPDAERRLDIDSPGCPACGKKMHVYMRAKGVVRYRCADYPRCRTFVKREKKGETNDLYRP